MNIIKVPSPPYVIYSPPLKIGVFYFSAVFTYNLLTIPLTVKMHRTKIIGYIMLFTDKKRTSL